MSSFSTWRARLPKEIGNWFARDLTRSALALVESERVSLRAVDDARLEAAVSAPSPATLAVEWAGGTGPQGLRAACGCGANGVCEHVVAALELVRRHREDDVEPAASGGDVVVADDPYDWLPSDGMVAATRSRARSVWPVLGIAATGAVTASLFLDTPRLRGVLRDPDAIVQMMDATPADDWDELDRALLRDDVVRDAFAPRGASRSLAQALFRLARHPRLRLDPEPDRHRHPSELPGLEVDVRGVRLRAARRGSTFVPTLLDADNDVVDVAGAALLDGPPSWLLAGTTAYLLDGAFDAKRVLAAAKREVATNGATTPPPAVIARVAPYLAADDRSALGVTDAESPVVRLALAWIDGALLAKASFYDRATRVSAPFSARGGIAQNGSAGFIRFGPDLGRPLHERLLAAGFVPRAGETFALFDPDRAAQLVTDVLPTWTDVDLRLDESLESLRDGGGLEIAVSAQRRGEQSDWFDLSVDVSIANAPPLSNAELSALLAGNSRYADVRGKLVDVSALREREGLLNDLLARRESGLASLLALRDELHRDFGTVRLPPDVEALREKLRDFAGIAHQEIPPGLDATLRDYQRIGLDFLAYLASFRFGGILADDMGTGKTLACIAYLLHRKATEGPAPSLVIAPTSVTHTWESEIAKFAPSLSTLRLRSGSDRAALFEEIPNYDVVITSYALARLDAQALASRRFRSLILDEAQNAKNPSSQIAKVVRALDAEHRLALTGTPVENSLRDLWAIFAFLEPGLLGSEASFRRRFELPIGDGDEKAAASLRARLEPFVLRRTKEDVAPELPERTEVALTMELSPLQRRLYRGIAEAARRDILESWGEGESEATNVHVLAALTRLRQVCAHPVLLGEQYADEPEASAKFDAFLETVDEILSGRHKVLVFSAFASMLRVMRRALEKREIPCAYLDGSTKERDRQSEIERFMRDDGPPVFLCSLKAGGVGLTLTAADYVILYDPWWNPAVERQAIDRTHRIGQQRAVTAYRLITQGTVEQKIRELAERKALLSKSVVKADSAIAKTLTRDDLEMLFADPD